MVPNFEIAAHAMSNFGIASLAIIFTGLIVTWLGYIKRLRWAWFVMFIIAWAWAFPVLVLPLLTHRISSHVYRIAIRCDVPGGIRANLDPVDFNFLVDGDCITAADKIVLLRQRDTRANSQSIAHVQDCLRGVCFGRFSCTLDVDTLSLVRDVAGRVEFMDATASTPATAASPTR